MAEIIRTYAELPEPVQDFLSDFGGIDFISDLVKKIGGTSDMESELTQLVRSVVFGTKSVSDVPASVEISLRVDRESAKRISVDLVKNRILPVGEILGLDVESALASWGTDPSEYANIPRIGSALVPETPEEPTVVQSALAENGATFSDPILQHRLELIAASFRDGVRTREQAVAVLMRSAKTGGLEMGKEEAEKVLDMVPVATPIVIEKLAEPEVAPEIAGAKPDHFTDDDAAEIAAIAEAKKAVLEVPTLITDTKAAADRIVAETGVSFSSGELRTRFDHIVDARLRDVRDGFATREKLEAPAEAGGVGMSGAPLVAVMEAVERMDAMHHLALGSKMDFLKEKITAEKAEREESAGAQKEQEAQVMSQRYAEITGKAPEAHVDAVPGRASVAIPQAQAVADRAQAIDTAKVRAAIEAAKPPAPVVTPVMSLASIPATSTGRPVVEDIRFERKLAGPVEELRMLTLSDFRRLSSDPEQAILRVRDKVEVSAQEGYEYRIAAIKAWRESPVSRMYVAASRDALMAGRGIVDILADTRDRGEDTLTDAELHAIVELNGILRF